VITVSAAKESGNLVMIVTDNGVGAPEEALSGRKVGVGLGSTRERLATMYPERHTFTLRRPAEGGTEVHIGLPLRFADREDPAFQDEKPAVADR
jgi:nitrate/nitrite-specific signal transduction histidine kinase